MADPTDAGGAYPSMPPIQPEPPVAAGPAPTPVMRAVQLMFAGAALGILVTIVTIADRDALREQILEDNPNTENVDTVVNATVTFSVVLGVVFTVLWIGLALMVRKGKNWARIVTWVLAGLGVLLTVVALLDPPSALSAILSGIGGILDLAIIVLLAMRPSNEFFKRRT